MTTAREIEIQTHAHPIYHFGTRRRVVGDAGLARATPELIHSDDADALVKKQDARWAGPEALPDWLEERVRAVAEQHKADAAHQQALREAARKARSESARRTLAINRFAGLPIDTQERLLASETQA
jgi:hypothetical protein